MSGLGLLVASVTKDARRDRLIDAIYALRDGQRDPIRGNAARILVGASAEYFADQMLSSVDNTFIGSDETRLRMEVIHEFCEQSLRLQRIWCRIPTELKSEIAPEKNIEFVRLMDELSGLYWDHYRLCAAEREVLWNGSSGGRPKDWAKRWVTHQAVEAYRVFASREPGLSKAGKTPFSQFLDETTSILGLGPVHYDVVREVMGRKPQN